jgi:methionine aminopeptidase
MDILTDDMVTKYHTAASICGKVYSELKEKIKTSESRTTKHLSEWGNQRIQEELSQVYKKEKTKKIAFPTSISLNNCLGNYIYDYQNENSEYNTIKNSDVIKIELGVCIGGCISVLCETFTIDDNPKITEITEFLNKMEKDLVKRIKHEETADELRIYFESKCTDNDVFPVENCISYQQSDGLLKSDEHKYMIFNYRKYYDMNDYLITPENINYEFEEHDVYTINLSVIPESDQEEPIKYKNKGDSHIYRINDYVYSLKLKSSRTFYNNAKAKNANYAFEIAPYLHDVKNRMGIKECLDNGILDKYPITYVQPNLPVITKKFTVLVGKKNSKVVKYF